jgi:hypothetical protein
LSPTELEYWLTFFLAYFRDGVGEVDHIDLDLTASGVKDTPGLFLTLAVPQASPPLSEEQARRRLGL